MATENRPIEEQLVKHLTDVHAIEEQALIQMRAAPKIAGDERLADIFRQHERETEEQERRVDDRLQAHGADPSKLKDLAGKAGGVGMAIFAKSQPDTPGKLTAHAYSYEHMELAAYELLKRVAERAGDPETVRVAELNGAEEQRMAQRLASSFDVAAEASLRKQDPDDLEKRLVKYLTDVHAIEQQAVQLLEASPEVAGDPELARLFEEHLEETREQAQRVEARLEAHGTTPSKVKDAILRLGGVNFGGFFGAQPDTPAKLAGFAYAFEHLEIASYELLRRVAQRAGDQETVEVAESILAQERAAAERLAATWDRAMSAALDEVGVSA